MQFHRKYEKCEISKKELQMMNTEVDGKLVKVKDGKMHIKVMGTGKKIIVYLPGWNEPNSRISHCL